MTDDIEVTAPVDLDVPDEDIEDVPDPLPEHTEPQREPVKSDPIPDEALQGDVQGAPGSED